MAKLTYKEIMDIMNNGLTNELIEDVIKEMGLNDESIHDDVSFTSSYKTFSNDFFNQFQIENDDKSSLYSTEEEYQEHQENVVNYNSHFEVCA